jgi:hypothetical protein
MERWNGGKMNDGMMEDLKALFWFIYKIIN